MKIALKIGAAMLLLSTGLMSLGCATIAKPIDLNAGISEGDGALFFASHSNFREPAMFEFYKISGDGPSLIKTDRLKPGAYQALLSVAPGRYTLKRAYLGPYWIDYYDGLMFDVLPNKVSYFGDVYLSQPSAGSISMDIQDRQNEAESLIDSVHPEFLERFPLQFTLVK